MPELSRGTSCSKCESDDAPHKMRGALMCSTCYSDFIRNKFVRRMGALHKQTRTSTALEPRRYAAALSFGPSSSALVNLLHEYAVTTQRKSGRSDFDVLVLHVDTDLSHGAHGAHGTHGDHGTDDDSAANNRMALYRQRYPLLSFEVVHLTEILDVKTVAWETLPLPAEDVARDPSERLRQMLVNLPSATARTDVLRQLVRHLLLNKAMRATTSRHTALLLGHTATRLAALVLSEVANGRGHAVPWQVNDGPFIISADHNGGSLQPHSHEMPEIGFPVHHPLRDIFDGEIRVYSNIADVPKDVVGTATLGSSVVSYKDQSIDNVMMRYFDTLDTSFPSIVSNVVRTAGKLSRRKGSELQCGLCGVILDEMGDTRWAGEVGDEEDERGAGIHARGGRLCYGCKRSIHG